MAFLLSYVASLEGFRKILAAPIGRDIGSFRSLGLGFSVSVSVSVRFQRFFYPR
jgi:hypothetical protein